MTDFQIDPDFMQYVKKYADDIKKHPELKAPPEYLDMTREE
jgi:hypothetical protein